MKKQIDLVQMPDLPEVLQRDISFEESRKSTDIQVLFSYCVQRVLHDCRANPKKFYKWRSGRQIIETFLETEPGEQLAEMLDCWLIQSVEDTPPPINTKPDRYRWDGSTGTLYEYGKEQGAYLFAAKGNGRTEQETIRDYEKMQLNSDTQ